MRVVIVIEKRALEASIACLEGEGFLQDETFGTDGVALDMDDPEIVRVRGHIPEARVREIERTVGVITWEDATPLKDARVKAEAVVETVRRMLEGDLPAGVTLLVVDSDGGSRLAPVPDEALESRATFDALVAGLQKPKSDD